jgi:2',3'-cyclic-nucleotide 2'-phosphodiesterase (5'-nucleotidase family)
LPISFKNRLLINRQRFTSTNISYWIQQAMHQLLFIFFFICFSFTVSAENIPSAKQITIIFASDMTEIGTPDKGGYPQLATLLNQYRAQTSPTFFLFGGSSLGPSALSSFDRGSHIIDLLNSLEPDVMGITKRDFSFLEDELSLRSYEAAFPFVASNILSVTSHKPLDGLNRSVIVEQGSYKLGILSMLDETAISEYGLKSVEIIEPRKIIAEQAKQLKQAGADLVILLYSGNILRVDQFLEQGTVDIIFRKDGYFKLALNAAKAEHPNHVFIGKPSDVAVVNVAWPPLLPSKNVMAKSNSQNKKFNVSWQTIDLNSLVKETQLLKQVREYQGRLHTFMKERLGITTTLLNTERENVRIKENAFGNLITDAVKNYTHADIALINGGTIRGDKIYKPNYMITRADIAKELPYRNRIVLVEVSGAQLLKVLFHSVDGVEKAKGQFLQVSGLQFSFDLHKNNTIQDVKVNGEKLKLDKKYKVATTDYLVNAGDGYKMLKDTKKLTYDSQMPKLLSDIVIDYIRTRQKISSVVESRIINLSLTEKEPIANKK